ncbi:hypothetical protein M8C21_029699, partial [Ambrosia artemisiifolia]
SFRVEVGDGKGKRVLCRRTVASIAPTAASSNGKAQRFRAKVRLISELETTSGFFGEEGLQGKHRPPAKMEIMETLQMFIQTFVLINKSQNDEELVTSAYSGDCLELKSKSINHIFNISYHRHHPFIQTPPPPPSQTTTIKSSWIQPPLTAQACVCFQVAVFDAPMTITRPSLLPTPAITGLNCETVGDDGYGVTVSPASDKVIFGGGFPDNQPGESLRYVNHRPPLNSCRCGFCSCSGIVNGLISNVASSFIKWASSLNLKVKTTTKTTMSGRPLMKFESGYNVETVLDGSKLGIEPHALHLLPHGELLLLDSANSNLYKISSSSLSLYSRPKLVAGSPDGHSGHVDGRLRDAKMSHPKGLTVDDKGNIYIADTANMAIRKISDTGVTTIAGGGRKVGHVDGPSEDAKFSNDFDVLYLGSSCSLLVIDRGNQAIREIQLPFDDCAYQYGSGFPMAMGIAVLVAAGFFGYMLALLQRRVGSMLFNQMDEPQTTMKPNIVPTPPYQKSTLRPLLIPAENEDEGFIASLGKLMADATSSFSEILTNIFPGLKRKKHNYHYQNQPPFPQTHKFGSNTWPVQDSYVIPDGDEPPPSIETRTRTPTSKKTYPFMTNDAEKIQQFRQSHLYSGWDRDYQQPQPQAQTQHHNRYYSSKAETYYEQSREKTNEIVFGALVQEEAESMVIKPLDHGDLVYDHCGKIRSRSHSRSHSRGFTQVLQHGSHVNDDFAVGADGD